MRKTLKIRLLILFTIAIVLLIEGVASRCLTQPPPEPLERRLERTTEPPSLELTPKDIGLFRPLSINIYNANLSGIASTPGRDFARRLKNIALTIAELDNMRGKAGNLFGFSEAYHTTTGGRLSRFQESIPGLIPCPLNGTQNQDTTHHCFFCNWFGALNAKLRDREGETLGAFGHQCGEVAILARRDIFEMVSGSDFITANIGPPAWGPFDWGSRRRYLIGARLQVKGTKYVLPFYSVHLSGIKRYQKDECRKIIEIVKDNWVEGDLTPVVVGDFNFSTKDKDQYKVMNKHFSEVGISYGQDSIEHIWVGREVKFPKNVGALRTKDFQYYREFNDFSANLTDHPISYAELEFPNHGSPAECKKIEDP